MTGQVLDLHDPLPLIFDLLMPRVSYTNGLLDAVVMKTNSPPLPFEIQTSPQDTRLFPFNVPEFLELMGLSSNPLIYPGPETPHPLSWTTEQIALLGQHAADYKEFGAVPEADRNRSSKTNKKELRFARASRASPHAGRDLWDKLGDLLHKKLIPSVIDALEKMDCGMRCFVEFDSNVRGSFMSSPH